MWLAHLKTVITTLLVFTNVLSSVYGKATEDLEQELRKLSLDQEEKELDQQERELNKKESSDDPAVSLGQAKDNIVQKMVLSVGSHGEGGGGVASNKGSSGVNYVHWGRNDCPDTGPDPAKLVYAGRIGGESHNHHGGGSQYLCMPTSSALVKYDQTTNGHQGGRGRVYGAEYQFEEINADGVKQLNDHDAVCAVCSTSKRGQQLMIPAAMECPDDSWTKEYHGYLMSARHNHQHSTGFICVDRQPQAVPGSGRSQDGSLLYLVESLCGGAPLPCGPYVEGHELTCVVCTK